MSTEQTKFMTKLDAVEDNIKDFIASHAAEKEAAEKGVEVLKSEIEEMRKQNQELAEQVKRVPVEITEREVTRAYGELIIKAASEGTDSAGGYVVEDEQDRMIRSIQNQYGVAETLYGSAIVPMASDVLNVPVDTFEVSGVSGTGNVPTPAATSENAAITESADAELSQVTLTAQKYATLNYISNELLDDAFVDYLGGYLLPKVARQSAKIEDGVILVDGFLASSNVQEVVIGGDSFGAMDSDDLLDMQDAIADDAVNMGRYISNRTVINLVRKLKGTDGHPIWTPIASDAPPAIHGFPYTFATRMPAKTATAPSTSFMLFGDAAMASVFGRRLGRRVTTSTDYRFNQDQVAVRNIFRIAWNDNANLGYGMCKLTTTA